jgi:phage gpG-like protein
MSNINVYPDVEIGEFHRIEIEALDFDKAAVALNELALYMEDVQLPLRGAARIAQDDMKARFDTEIGPDGAKWTALDIDYAKRKEHDKGFEHPILTYDRDLRDAATSSKAFTVSADSIWYNTDVFADIPYWRVQQEGSAEIAFDSPEGAAFQNIPARPFIGLSKEAESRILELFDIWFSNGIEKAASSYAISSSGILQERTSTGRLGPKVLF